MEAEMHYESEVRIDAPVTAVWQTLTDVASWPTWDSGVSGVDGTIAPGSKITIHSEAAPGRAFPVRVTDLEPGESLELTGGMPLGLFKGVRRYTLVTESDQTVMTVREVYSGPMLRLIAKSMPDLQPSFDQFTAGLKQRVEGR